MQAIVNGRLVLETKVLDGCALLFDKTIKKIVSRETLDKMLEKVQSGKGEEDIQVTDAGNLYVSPGFINLHIHGCAGADTMDGSREALDRMSIFQATSGVTAFLPTTMTCDWEEIYRALEAIRGVMTRIRPRRKIELLSQAMEKEPKHEVTGTGAISATVMGDGKMQINPIRLSGAKVLGAYLEGPFINQEYKGAQKEEKITWADFEKIFDYTDVIKFILLAPETIKTYRKASGLETFLKQCRSHGIIVSMGHSGASYAEAMTAIKLGVRHVTHLFNAMSGLHHRLPGVACAALDSKTICELIADDLHIHPAIQRLSYRLKGASQLELITDSLRACGIQEGKSELGGQTVYIEGGVARLDDGTLAGSTITLNRAMANFRKNTGAPVWEVVKMVTGNQAQELDLFERIGSLCPGAAADITIFDKDFTIYRTYVDGELIYKNPASQ